MDTQKRKDLFLGAFGKSLNVARACKAAGIARKTFYNWKNQDRRFCEAVEDLEMSVLEIAQSVLIKKIKVCKDLKATIFFLKTKGKKLGYSEKIEEKEEQENKEPYSVQVTIMQAGEEVEKIEELRELEKRILKYRKEIEGLDEYLEKEGLGKYLQETNEHELGE